MNETQQWKIIESLFSKNLIHHQLSSFNDFITFDIQRIIKDEAKIIIPLENGATYEVSFSDIYISNPSITENRELRKITPDEARMRDLTYDSPLHVDIVEKTIDASKNIVKYHLHRRIIIARIPIMVGSILCNVYNMTSEEKIKYRECAYDNGGYFIIKGKERVLISQCRNMYNKILVFQQNMNKKSGNKYSHIAEMRSMSNETGHSVLIKACFGVDKRTITFSIPYIKDDIPVGVIFKALGFTTQQEIIELIGLQESHNKKLEKYLNYIIRDSWFVQTREKALDYIGQFSIHTILKDKRIGYAQQVVETELFPHLGISSTNKEKALLLGYILNKLLRTITGIRSSDDRDNYANKRIETAGILMEELFKTLFKRYIKVLNLQLQKRQDVLLHISKISSSITLGLKHSFSTGSWGVQKNSYIRTGVSQVLSRLSFGATISHLRRLMLPIGKEGKNVKIRQIHTSQYGFIDPSETPEGIPVGTVLNFSFTTRVSRHISSIFVKEIIEGMENVILIDNICITKQLSDSDKIYMVNLQPIEKKYYRIFLNGIFIGITYEFDKFIQNAYEYKKNNILDKSISLSYDTEDSEINIHCDKGRMIRPLFTVTNGHLNILNEDLSDPFDPDWDDLVNKDYIRYIDSSEIEMSTIAMTFADISEETEYCEIHPSMMFGVCAGKIPFADHSQSPRICYQSSMGKQALSMFATSYQHRTDTIVHVLDYPQKSLVSTKPAIYMGFDEMPSGINCIVAIMCYTGRNQEDSIIMNKSSVDRGLFSVTSYRTIVGDEKKRSVYISEMISIPDLNLQNKTHNYSMLLPNGLIRKGVRVKKGDVIIGKITIKSDKNGEEKKFDCSTVIKAGEEGVIDRVYDMVTPNGYRLVKIVIRNQRIPEIGDKFASEHAQKGTCGHMYNQEDMPFTQSGIYPDIIINPHCLTGDTMITLSDGKMAMIKDIYNCEVSIKTVSKYLFTSDTYFYGGFKLLSQTPILKLRVSSGKTIKCTHDHMFYVFDRTNMWKKAIDINLNKDKMIMMDGDIITYEFLIEKVEIQPELVYDFTTVSENHSFIANGFISHNCQPSRMTTNQLIDTIMGKKCVMTGKLGNGTPFGSNSTNIVPEICEDLKRLGFNRYGNEQMYNGFTGEPIEAAIFIGPTHYQRLKHMVSDKIHARAFGNVTNLTRQPSEGRSYDGGLRFGEMERDIMIGSGLSRFLKERLFDMSDPYQIYICRNCNMMSKTTFICTECNDDNVCRVNLPFAAKLLFSELQAMGIKISIFPDE